MQLLLPPTISSEISSNSEIHVTYTYLKYTPQVQSNGWRSDVRNHPIHFSWHYFQVSFPTLLYSLLLRHLGALDTWKFRIFDVTNHVKDIGIFMATNGILIVIHGQNEVQTSWYWCFWIVDEHRQVEPGFLRYLVAIFSTTLCHRFFFGVLRYISQWHSHQAILKPPMNPP